MGLKVLQQKNMFASKGLIFKRVRPQTIKIEPQGVYLESVFQI